ncbi:MAG: DUF1566 domain-containing protein [Mitsuaria chitosanitabida]|nr:DUF1566 domain-containing protein [Roseateles chitosanitabidus]
MGWGSSQRIFADSPMKGRVPFLAILIHLAAVGLSLPVAAEPVNARVSTLEARDLDGDGVADAFYDTVLNITWLQDWNLAKTKKYSGATADGGMDWITSLKWASELKIGGYDDWRLPTVSNGVNEIAHLYFETLGHTDNWQVDYSSNLDGRPFVNFSAGFWWLGTEDPLDSGRALNFWNGYGFRNSSVKTISLYAVAVRDGDVREVPEPSSLPQVLASLVLLQVFWRYRRTTM